MQQYKEASWQQTNLENITLFLSYNVGEWEFQAIKNIWLVQSIKAHERYWIYHHLWVIRQLETFKDLKSQIWQKLQGWKGKFLS